MSAIRTMCPDTGSYAYHYRSCERVTVAPVSAAAFALLVTAGVAVQRSI